MIEKIYKETSILSGFCVIFNNLSKLKRIKHEKFGDIYQD